nr:MAG TPA: hypothetical protein [Caudoviricetes sp.]
MVKTPVSLPTYFILLSISSISMFGYSVYIRSNACLIELASSISPSSKSWACIYSPRYSMITLGVLGISILSIILVPNNFVFFMCYN